MNKDMLHHKLVHAATAYDIRQSRGKYYNRYALAQMLKRIDEVEADIERGAPVRQALLRAFSDRLLDTMLKGIGEPKFTLEEKRAASRAWSYQPVTEGKADENL